MHYVYRFINIADTIIYVGRTSESLTQRFLGHHHLPDECYRQVKRIEYIECATAAETALKEIYYINLYKNNKPYYNKLDLREPIQGIELHDEWKQYQEKLPPFFANAVNRMTEEEFASRKNNHAVCTSMDYLEEEEVNDIVNYFINVIIAESKHQDPYCLSRVIALRNLLLFEMGINTPLRSKELLTLSYNCFLYNKNGIYAIKYKLSRNYKDEIIDIRLPEHVCRLIELYIHSLRAKKEELNQHPVFKSRQGNSSISTDTAWRVLKRASESCGVRKAVGNNTLRKTYFMHIYTAEANKTAALMFLDRLNGGQRFNNIGTYLALPEVNPDYQHFFSDEFMLGSFDVKNIMWTNCQKIEPVNLSPQLQRIKQLERERMIQNRSCMQSPHQSSRSAHCS